MENTLEEFAKYLTDTLDIKVDPKKWHDSQKLPMYLRNSYNFYQTSILNSLYLLMVPRDDQEKKNSRRLLSGIIFLRFRQNGMES